VLLDSALGEPDSSEALERFWEAEEAALDADRLADAVELNVEMWAPRATPAAKALVRDMQARAFALQEDPALDVAALDPPLHERLGEIAIPTIVAHGDTDVEDFLAIAQRLSRELPDARLVPIAGSGHLPALEQPAVVAGLILDAAG
jgi:pimeloyl-ACP methyl ester carboxylesterase